MNLKQLEHVLVESSKLTNHRNFVVVGSLSVMGAVIEPPADMVMSVDVDFYLKFDPERTGEIVLQLGEGSAFEQEYGYYADPISPKVLSLPEGWESRLIPLSLQGGVVGWFLDPNDAACAKLIRGAQNDQRWIKAGLDAGILNAHIVGARLPSTTPTLEGELARANTLFKLLQASF
jgi:hypothetical protein